MRKLKVLIVAMVIALLGCVSASMAAPPPVVSASNPTPDQLEFFEKKIRPVLVDKCYECHSEVKRKIKGKLRVDDYAAMLKGGDSGKPAIVPGDPDKSVLITAITYEDKDTDSHDAVLMPPPKNGKARKLPDSVIKDFKDWVKMGAPYPTAPAHADAAPDQRKQHWAFVAPKQPTIPQVTDASWVKNDIDRFILSKLEAQNLHPSHPADKRTLIRRATFDLIGLPPTDGEVKDFENDSSSAAFATVIDRLLASPHYGERWGRYWLDVARYADTKGYVFEEERRYPYSYTYRDWVISALNADLPYDQFLIDQIAADRLDLKDDARSALAAEGFLTLGRRFLNNQTDIIDDRIDVLCRGTMALTVGCARCHDHKFDPISQKDYYALYSVFNNSPEARDLPLIGDPKPTPEYARFTKQLATKEAALNDYSHKSLDSEIAKLRTAKQITLYLMATHTSVPTPAPTGKRRKGDSGGPVGWVTQRWTAYLSSHAKVPVFAPWQALSKLPPEEFAAKAPAILDEFSKKPDANKIVLGGISEPAPVSLNEVAERYGHVLATADGPVEYEYADEESLRQVLRGPDSPTTVKFEERAQIFATPEAQRERALRREIEAFKASDPGAPPRAMALEDAAGNAPQHVFLRGNAGNPGPLVKPAFLSVLSTAQSSDFKQGSGRLEMARDIASRDNPLTARVMVNRIWLHHFGKGLVRTPSDFGLRSDPPTHPELLDWLALRFENDHWSMKSLHKLIMLSAAYQQSSDVDAAVQKADPDNMLVSHFNRQRLDWEATRDSLLYVSGQLDPKLGGRPVEVLESPRRTVYGFIDRQNLPGVFRAFDFATPDATSPQRFTTTVPQQALFLMNSPFAVQQAKALVNRSEVASSTDEEARVVELYELAYQRKPTAEELSTGRQFIESESATSKLNAWQQYAQVLLESNEFVFVD